jgi:putative drug exporter of the RND superfamily
VTERLARACARRPWLTVGAWLGVFLLAVVAIVLFLGSALSSEGELTVELESDRAYRLIGESFPPDPDDDFVNELVLVRSAQLRVDDPGFRRGVESLLTDIRSVEGIHNATSFYESQDRSLVSPDRRATLIPIGLGRNPEGEVEQVIALVEEADRGPLDVWITGEFTADRDVDLILDEDLKTGEFYFGIPAALLVLVLVFGALVAAVVPVAIAKSCVSCSCQRA